MSTSNDGATIVSDVIVQGPPPEGCAKTPILVGILSGEGTLRSELFVWREFLMSLSADPDHPFYYRFAQVIGARPAVLAHNCLADLFYNNPSLGDWLWIWADDMRPLPTSTRLLEAIEAGADLATLMVYIWSHKDGAPLLTAGIEKTDHEYEMWNLPRNWSMYPIEASGTGGLLINRRVFEHPEMLLAPATDEHPVTFFRDEYLPCGMRDHGHDLDFTRRATKLGFTLLAHPEAWAGHLKRLDLYEVALYVERFATEAMRAKAKEWVAKLSENPLTSDFVSALEGLIRDDLYDAEAGSDAPVSQ